MPGREQTKTLSCCCRVPNGLQAPCHPGPILLILSQVSDVLRKELTWLKLPSRHGPGQAIFRNIHITDILLDREEGSPSSSEEMLWDLLPRYESPASSRGSLDWLGEHLTPVSTLGPWRFETEEDPSDEEQERSEYFVEILKTYKHLEFANFSIHNNFFYRKIFTPVEELQSPGLMRSTASMNEPEVAEYVEVGEERIEFVQNRVQDSRRVTRSVTLRTRSVVNLLQDIDDKWGHQDISDSSDEDVDIFS